MSVRITLELPQKFSITKLILLSQLLRILDKWLTLTSLLGLKDPLFIRATYRK